MGWRTDKALTVAQLSNNMSDSLVPDTTYWQAYAYQQIKNILTGMDNRIPISDDFTDIPTAIADSDVTTFGGLLLTGATDLGDTPADIPSDMAFSGVGAITEISSDNDKRIFQQKASTSPDRVSFQNMAFDGNSTEASGAIVQHAHAIDMYQSGQTSTNNIIGPNIWIKDVGGDGVYLRESDKNIVHALNIDVNNQAIGANLRGRNGIAVTDGDSLIIANCYIRRAGNAGIDLEPNATEDISRVVISNCVIEDSLYGIAIPGGAGASPPISYVSISNCVIKVGDKSATGFNTTTIGIIIQAAETVCMSNIWVVGQSDQTKSGTGIFIDNADRVYLNNVNVTRCDRGLQIFSDNGTNDYISIIGGEFSENQKHGLSLNGSSGNHIGNLIVKGVQIFNNDNGDTGFDGIRVDYCDNLIVDGCLAFDDQGSQTQDRGITVQNSGNVVISNNICYGNTVSQIQLNSNTTNEYGHNIGAISIT
ncbi:hypothetical protein LCGC14_0351270 [marine sediment metagenome]|uniref:Right handed beta helix domain-containing protein n=1 Tax=marine sediment metagenome TaxID=412755 RepID=A0A0F9WIN0_9ZZZZ